MDGESMSDTECKVEPVAIGPYKLAMMSATGG